MEKRLRAQRVLVFREYLRMLDADFRRLCDGLDAGTPVRLRWQAAFAWKVLEVQFQVTLYRFRLAEVDVLPLLGVFEALRAELGRNTLHAERATA
jgi:hypothetical protein